MNYYKQGDAANANKIRAAFEKLGYDVTGFDMCNDNILFFTYKLQTGANVISTTNAHLYTANIIKTHPDYQELELPSKLKFKVGDWITDGNITIQIEDVRNNSYMYSDGVLFSTGTADKVYHLWTLADIKYGDVLANTAGCILIVKDNESCLCYIDKNGKFHANNNKWFFANFSDNVLTPATKEQRELLLYKMKESGYELNEKKQLHKIIEPKFKVGDSIVNDYCFGKVIEITNDAYLLDTGQGIPFSCEHNAHLWTIQDARNGDVLACYSEVKGKPIEQVGIFKQYAGRHGGCSNAFLAHTGIDWDGNIIINEYMGSTNILPATKKQCNLLFKKIQEAGYQWDADKKELKKIPKHYDIANFQAGIPVLVRDKDNRKWCYLLYSHYDNTYDDGLCFNAGSVDWRQCIPFEGNEALLGTTDMPSEEYINW